MSRASGDRSLLDEERGQTLQDYAIGISLFLLATAFAFSFAPSVFTPFSAPVDAAQTEQADRVAGEILAEITTDDTTNVLDATATDAFFADDSSLDAIPLSRGTSVNVTLVDGHGTVQRSIGDPHEGQSTAATTRIVADEPGASGGYACSATCRVEVRVWR